MFSFFGYIFLFILLCVFLLAVVASFNIYKKSYYPKNAIIITSVIIFLILINSVMAVLSLTRAKDGVQNITAPSTVPKVESKSF
jgi:hypothetical protein